MSLPAFQLIPTATNAAADFALAHGFKQGDVPAGASVVAPFSNFQCIPVNRWPDGSLKVARLAGSTSVVAGTPLSVQLSVGAAATGTPIAASAITAVATFDCGAFGAATFSGADWASPWSTEVSGPKMSQFRYRKQVGTDAHLVAWVEVRVWASGAVEMLPWIENGYFRVAAPTRKNALCTFTLGGATRFSDYVGIDVPVTYGGGASLTTAYGSAAISPIRVRSGSLLGTLTWQSADGNGINTYGVAWDTSAPGAIAAVNVLGLPHHTRAVLIDGTKLSHWLGADPGVTPFHDQAYLMATELVPTYIGVRSATGMTNLPTTWAPLQKGGLIYDGDYGPDQMTNPSYQPCIGLLPEHDVAYLVCNDQPKLLYGAVLRNAFALGRYGIHYRDETTQHPPAFATYPTLVFQDNQGFANTGDSTTGTKTPVASGGNAPIWDTAHHPSAAYLAALISGWSYFVEETQFAVVANHFYITDWVRAGGLDGAPGAGYTGASGLCLGGQTRATGWALRTLAQALAITPDVGDPFRATLINTLEENARWFHQIYVAQPNNPFGVIQGGDETNYGGNFENNRSAYPPWQMNFVTASIGMALCLGLPLSSTAATKLAAFYQWTAKSAFITLGTAAAGDWNYINGAVYTVSVSPVLVADYRGGTGPWLTVGQSYAYKTAEYVDSYGIQPWGTTPGVLALGFPESAVQGFKPSMWHNMQPALAYAVRHNVPGALAARTRMTSASNWSQIQAVFNVTPGWSVVPSGQTQSGVIVPVPTAIFDVDPTGTDAIFDEYQGQGFPLSAVPASGADALSPVRAVMQSGDSPLSEVLINYISTPPGFAPGGDTSYASPVGAVTYQITLDGTPLPQATDTISAPNGGGNGGGAQPVVSGVSVTPQNSVISGGGSINFDWVVSGVGTISQGATCKTSLGSIDATGQLVAPAAIGVDQTGTVTITSTQDPTQKGTATFIVLAAGTAPTLNARNVTIQFGPQPSANLTGLSVAFYDEAKPHLATAARYQSGAQTTDAQGRMQFGFQSTLPVNGVGSIVVNGPNGLHYNGPCGVS